MTADRPKPPLAFRSVNVRNAYRELTLIRIAKQATASTGRGLVDVPATGGLPTRDTLLGRAET